VLDNSLDSLVHRHLSERGTENEHEYLWFVAGEELEGDPVSLDVFIDERTLTVASDTSVKLREFFEAVEAWYPVKGRKADTYSVRNGEWRQDRPKDVLTDTEEVEHFDFHFYDDFDYFRICISDYEVPKEDLPDREVSMTVEYDNADNQSGPDVLEPLITVFPNTLGDEVSEKAKYQAVTDILKYVNSSRDFQRSYDALNGFKPEIFRY